MNDILEVANLETKVDCNVYTSPSANIWFTSKSARICRVGIDYMGGTVRRYTQYIWFNLRVFISLLFFNPTKILAYETMSILPIYLILLLRKTITIHIHYHEYTSFSEIEKGSAYFKLLHRLEKKLWQKPNVMLSHTNEDRKRLFLEDYTFIDEEKVSFFPNYPPSSWYAEAKKKRKDKQVDEPIRLVHVGALGLESMYVKEIVDWVLDQKGRYELDFYLTSVSADTKVYLDNLTSTHSNIRFKHSVRYFDLLEVLMKYDVGLVLYRGHIPNYVYNVPNKVIEYLACGLQVWYSKKLVSTAKFVSTEKINGCLKVNFDDLNFFNPKTEHFLNENIFFEKHRTTNKIKILFN